MKKFILAVAALTILIAAVRVTQSPFFAGLRPEKRGFDQSELARIASQLNAILPKQLDHETRLDSATAGPGHRLTYFYTIVNRSSTEVDPGFITALKPQLVNRYKSQPDMASFREWQLELHYHYRDKHGREVAAMMISPNDF